MLIPAPTLEDFPSDLSDYDARSLLAAWTVLWHPALLHECQQLPTWYRADAPPDPIGRRLITLPTASIAQLPAGYQVRADDSEECQLITGGTRAEMLESLALDPPEPLRGGGPDSGRQVGVEDFLSQLAAWGGPDGDVNGDGTTNVGDFLDLLAAWGPCP